MKHKNYPLRKTMCATCPFKEGSKYAYLVETLAQSAITTDSRICHSTGSNAINKKTGKKPHICRGARDIQLRIMASLCVISDPTDKAWNNGRIAIGLEPTEIKDP